MIDVREETPVAPSWLLSPRRGDGETESRRIIKAASGAAAAVSPKSSAPLLAADAADLLL
uniref:Uncharacterized protein n=1 Tax=Oryza sativa subsp. japonica TaxID=39947 RepID=Q6ESF7_ORYSJ|nr:hypothetical protein [Oryza sativa Japonica Group]